MRGQQVAAELLGKCMIGVALGFIAGSVWQAFWLAALVLFGIDLVLWSRR